MKLSPKKTALFLAIGLLMMISQAAFALTLDCEPKTPFANTLSGTLEIGQLTESEPGLSQGTATAEVKLRLLTTGGTEEAPVPVESITDYKSNALSVSAQFLPAGTFLVTDATVYTVTQTTPDADKFSVRIVHGLAQTNATALFQGGKYTGHCSVR